jgi:hypothetical protein
MSRRCVVVWLAVLALAVSTPTRAAGPAVRSGDLVFETSSSSQSWAIRWATHSPWSHVGIVDVGRDGTYVVEAIGKVSRTPWDAWRRRARRGGDLLVLRPRSLPEPLRAAAVERAKGFLGRGYDARFGWGDDRIYCSELVVKAYERAAGVSFGRRERLGDLRLLGLRRAIERRWGGPVPEDLVLVTPASIAEDGRLETVYEGRP